MRHKDTMTNQLFRESEVEGCWVTPPTILNDVELHPTFGVYCVLWSVARVTTPVTIFTTITHRCKSRPVLPTL